MRTKKIEPVFYVAKWASLMLVYENELRQLTPGGISRVTAGAKYLQFKKNVLFVDDPDVNEWLQEQKNYGTNFYGPYSAKIADMPKRKDKIQVTELPSPVEVMNRHRSGNSVQVVDVPAPGEAEAIAAEANVVSPEAIAGHLEQRRTQGVDIVEEPKVSEAAMKAAQDVASIPSTELDL